MTIEFDEPTVVRILADLRACPTSTRLNSLAVVVRAFVFDVERGDDLAATNPKEQQ